MANADNLLQSALMALAAGRNDSARRILTSFVVANPRNERGWLYLAVTLPHEHAIEALQRVLLLNPGNRRALRSLRLLRQGPEVRLDLADVLVDEEEDTAIFGDEPATQASDLRASFGEEEGTIPFAFYSLVRNNCAKANEAEEPSIIGALLAEEWTARPQPKLFEQELAELGSKTEPEIEVSEDKVEPAIVEDEWASAATPVEATIWEVEAEEVKEIIVPNPPVSLSEPEYDLWDDQVVSENVAYSLWNEVAEKAEKKLEADLDLKENLETVAEQTRFEQISPALAIEATVQNPNSEIELPDEVGRDNSAPTPEIRPARKEEKPGPVEVAAVKRAGGNGWDDPIFSKEIGPANKFEIQLNSPVATGSRESSLFDRRIIPDKPARTDKKLVTSSWADSSSTEDERALVVQKASTWEKVFDKKEDTREAKLPVTAPRLAENERLERVRLPVSSVYVDPRSIEGRAGMVKQDPQAAALRQPARRVDGAPGFNLNMPLPTPKPSSHRRSHRLHNTPGGLTGFGYFIVILIVVIVIIYLYMAMQQGVPVSR